MSEPTPEPTPVPAVPDRRDRPAKVDCILRFYRDGKNDIRWRITDAGNHRKLDASPEGYRNFADAARTASELYVLPISEVKSGSPAITRPNGTVWAVVQDDDDA